MKKILPSQTIEKLQSKSLIKIHISLLRIHPLLQIHIWKAVCCLCNSLLQANFFRQLLLMETLETFL